MQATMTQTNSHNPFRFFFTLILVALLAVIALIAIDYAASHGPLRHPGDAETVRQCLNQNGALQIWVNPTTGRRANLCLIEPGKFGIQIIQQAGDKWEEVTAFVKQKMHNLDDVMRYLGNTGYYVIH